MHASERGYTRRGAMAALGAGAALLLAGRAGRAAPAAGQLMRRIPSTSEALPAMGLGTAYTFDVGADAAARAPLAEVVRRFAAAGGRVIDTAPSYGEAERVVGDLVRTAWRGERPFLATKVAAGSREAGREQLAASSHRLGTPIDLVQVHNLIAWRDQLALLREWKSAGRVRYVGVTHYTARSLGDLTAIVKSEEMDFVQINYSLGERDAEARLLPLAADRGVAVLVNRPFAQAELFRAVAGKPLPGWAADFDCASWAQFFLKFALSHPAVTCVLPATANPAHLADNMEAGLGRLPDEAQRRRMTALFDAL